MATTALKTKNTEIESEQSGQTVGHRDEPIAQEIEISGGRDRGTEEIAYLAYTYWEARGRQGGSPEEDWFRAEQELRLR